eukprot:3809434-Rhodomonas_salina.1
MLGQELCVLVMLLPVCSLLSAPPYTVCEIKHKKTESPYNLYQECAFLRLISWCPPSQYRSTSLSVPQYAHRRIPAVSTGQRVGRYRTAPVVC